MGWTEELGKLGELRDKGLITEAEFEARKRLLLPSSPVQQNISELADEGEIPAELQELEDELEDAVADENALVEVFGYWMEPGANLHRANLTGANLTGADLTRADLLSANLHRANLTDADLTRANLEGATADQRTVWPEGFDPVSAGVIIE